MHSRCGTYFSGSLVLIFALSYGLIKVPYAAWEERFLDAILGYEYYMAKKYNDLKRDSLLELELQYSVLEALEEKVTHTQQKVDDRRQAITIMHTSIPISISKHLKTVSKSNTDYLKSKHLSKPLINYQTLVSFNSELKAAIWDFEMCDHLAEKNLIDIYYYKRIQDCIRNGDRFVEDKFTQFKNREFIFRMFPGFEFKWFKYLHYPWSVCKFAMLTTLSVLVFIGEMHLYFQYKPVANFLVHILYWNGGARTYVLLFCVSIYFGYMVIVSCYSIFSIKIFGFYGFYIKKTDPLTFLTFVFYMSKLTYPLCYTTLYIFLGNSELIERTSFYGVACGSNFIEYWQPQSCADIWI